MSHGRSANLTLVGPRAFTAWRIDYQGDPAIFHVVDQIRPAFLELVDHLDLDICIAERLRRRSLSGRHASPSKSMMTKSLPV